MNPVLRSRIAWLALALVVFFMYQRHELFGTGVWSIGVQIAAGLLWVWARVTFGLRSFHGSADPTAGGLVTTGPYRLLRHPIYASFLYFIWAGVAAHPSWLTLVWGLLATAAVGERVASEEQLLVGMYPDYAAYAARTRRVLPFVL